MNEKKYANYIFSHEIYKIPVNHNDSTLYGLDNAYYFDKIPNYDQIKEQHDKNILTINPFFINNKLPENKLKKNNIVIHIRGGDAVTCGRGNNINKYNNQLLQLLPILFENYKNYTYYIHSDDNVDFVVNIMKQYNIDHFTFEKKTNVLEVLSDLIHSEILIMGVSSLSLVCSFLGKHQLIICHDECRHSKNNKTIKISDFISSNSSAKIDTIK